MGSASVGAMNKLSAGLVAAWSVALGLSLYPRNARACGQEPCVGRGVLPRDGSTVPENTQAFAVSAGFPQFGPELSVAITLVRNGADLSFSTRELRDAWRDILVIPGEPLHEGDTLVLGVDSSCGPVKSEFTVGPPAEFPSSAGSLEVVERGVDGVDAPISEANPCGPRSYRSAFASLEFRPSKELEPFLGLATIRLETDGPSTDLRVETHCASTPGPVERTARVLASIPGVEDPAISEPISITLTCSTPSEAFCAVGAPAAAGMSSGGPLWILTGLGLAGCRRMARRGRSCARR